VAEEYLHTVLRCFSDFQIEKWLEEEKAVVTSHRSGNIHDWQAENML